MVLLILHDLIKRSTREKELNFFVLISMVMLLALLCTLSVTQSTSFTASSITSTH